MMTPNDSGRVTGKPEVEDVAGTVKDLSGNW
jgi:hypothetical protein